MEFWINNQSVLYCIDLLNMSQDLGVQPVGAGTSLVFHAMPNSLTNIKKWSKITIVLSCSGKVLPLLGRALWVHQAVHLIVTFYTSWLLVAAHTLPLCLL